MSINDLNLLNKKNSSSTIIDNTFDYRKNQKVSASSNNINISNYLEQKKLPTNYNKIFGKDIFNISEIKTNIGRNYSEEKTKNNKNISIVYKSLNNNINNINTMKIDNLPKKIDNYISNSIKNKTKTNQMKYLTIKIKDDKVKLKENDIHCNLSNVENTFDSNYKFSRNGELNKNNLINNSGGIIKYEVEKYNSNLLENNDKKYDTSNNLYCNLGNLEISGNKYTSINDSNKILINNIGIINNYK